MNKDFNLSDLESDRGFGQIDYKRIGYQIIRYWYLVVISLAIALLFAFYNNRYTQRIYPVSASIIIREKEETNGAEILYKNNLVDQYRNYLNEPYIIRSYPIIQKVTEALNFDAAFYKEGYIVTTEAYRALPLGVRVLERKGSSSGSFVFKALSPETYSIQPDGDKQASEFQFGAVAVIQGFEFIINKTESASLEEHLNFPYKFQIKDPLQVAAEYVGKLNVDWAEEGAGVINVTVNGPIPAKEIDFLNGLIVNYQRYDLDKKNQTAERTVQFIKSQLVEISDSLRLFEGKLQQFKKNNSSSGNLSTESQRVFSKIELLETQKGELTIKENYYDYIEKYLGESASFEHIILPNSIGITDPILANLISKIIDLQMEVKLYTDRNKTTNPIIKNKTDQLSELKRDILESVKSLRSTDEIKLNFLNKQISTAEKQLSYLPLAERQLISIQRNYSLLENLYVFLMQKMSEAEISKASNISDIVMVNPPMLAGGAITPRVFRNYSIAFVFGLGIPLLIFVFLELINTRVQSKEDIERLTNIPFMGGVGHKKGDNNLEVLRSPKSSISESFRSLRSNLNYFTNQGEKAVFLIGSSISGEGKTFTAINLASVFSLSGKKTLIIGADMRKPKLFMDFGLTNTSGLSTFLAGLSTFEEIIQKTKFDKLDLISGGPVPPNPSELLLSENLDELIKRAKETYDYIIIDTPPMAVVADAFALSDHVDHFIFLVRQNYTPKFLLRTIQDYYSSGKIKKIGIVFNDVYKSGPGYGYGYVYGYGYGYERKNGGYGYYTE